MPELLSLERKEAKETFENFFDCLNLEIVIGVRFPYGLHQPRKYNDTCEVFLYIIILQWLSKGSKGVMQQFTLCVLFNLKLRVLVKTMQRAESIVLSNAIPRH